MKAASLCLGEATHEDPGTGSTRGPAAREPWPVSILGLPFENISLAAAVARVEALIAAGRPQRITTVNLELLLHARRDPEQQDVLATADVLLCDSRALVGASWCLGNPLPEPIRAHEFAVRLMQVCAGRGFRVFVLDGKPGRAVECAQQLARSAPGLRIVGVYSPDQPHSIDGTEVKRRLRTAPADILFERVDPHDGGRWLAGRHRELGTPVCVQCCLTPEALRAQAPTPVPAEGSRGPDLQRGPRQLLRRLTRAAALAPALLQQWACMSHAGRRPPARAAILNASREWLDVDAGLAMTRAGCDASAALWRRAETGATNWAIDVSRVEQIDATGMAVLTRCRVVLEHAGRQCVLVAPTEPVRLALIAAQLWTWFDVAATLRAAHQRAPAPAHTERGVTRSLAWCGEIISANAEDVWQMTAEYVRTFVGAGATLVVIDLSRLRLVDPAGVALMVRMKAWARNLRLEILYTHPRPMLCDLLTAARVDRLLLEGNQ